MLVRQFLEGEAELLSSEELTVVFLLHKRQFYLFVLHKCQFYLNWLNEYDQVKNLLA